MVVGVSLHLSICPPIPHTVSALWLIVCFMDYIYIYIYIIVEKSPNSSHMYDHGFMYNTNRQAVKNWPDSQTRDASLVCESGQFLTAWRLVLYMKPWSYIWLEFGLFSTIIAIIRACACWALFVVTLTNTVHFIYIYIYIYIYMWHKYNPWGDNVSHNISSSIDQRSRSHGSL